MDIISYQINHLQAERPGLRSVNEWSFPHFSPSGWDSENKIAILYENIKSANPDDSFSEVIMKPLIRKVGSNFAAWKDLRPSTDILP